jgi:hypothetical protein
MKLSNYPYLRAIQPWAGLCFVGHFGPRIEREVPSEPVSPTARSSAGKFELLINRIPSQLRALRQELCVQPLGEFSNLVFEYR